MIEKDMLEKKLYDFIELFDNIDLLLKIKSLKNVLKEYSRIYQEFKREERQKKRNDRLKTLEHMKKKNCILCGVSFTARTLSQIYCNGTCANAAIRKKRKDENAG